jgi:hypothetical protein
LSYTFSLAGNDDIPEIVSIYNSLVGIPGCTWNAEYPNIVTAESDINNKPDTLCDWHSKCNKVAPKTREYVGCSKRNAKTD